MLAALYLLLALGTGMALIAPVLFKNEDTPSGPRLNPVWILLSGGAAAGILLGTWLLYLIAWILKVRGGIAQPLYAANAIVMGGEGAVCIFLALRYRGQPVGRTLVEDRGLFRRECIFYAGLFLFILVTFCHVLFVKDGKLYAGYTVFSDYAPHLAMVRSFSRSANYPTMYPHFGGEDVKYHFMFQFLTGNLEFLGLRLDVAYNLAGILFMWTLLVVLTQLARRLWGRMGAGVLTAAFFFFRSGLSVFRFVFEHLAAGDLLQVLAENRVFIGYTPNENWGLWNYNVYLNQRHLAFGLTLAGILVWFYLDYLVRAENNPATGPVGTLAAEGVADRLAFIVKQVRVLYLTPEAWLPDRPWQAAFLGILLGLTAFWNGAAVIGCLLILLGFTLFSRHKLDYALTAGAAVLISFLQTNFFISGSAVSAGFFWGFICEDKSLSGIIVFLLYISGLTILGGLGLLFFLKGVRRTYLAAMFLPVIFTFTMSLTPDVTVNQKYIMIACAFLAPVWGGFVEKLLGRPEGDGAPESDAAIRPEGAGEPEADAAIRPEGAGEPESDAVIRSEGAGEPEADAAIRPEGAEEPESDAAIRPEGDGEPEADTDIPAADRQIAESRRVLTISGARRQVLCRAAGIVLIFLLTATGLYDFAIIVRDNGEEHSLVVPLESEVTDWIDGTMRPDQLILTPWYSLSEVTLSGKMLYLGWPYYAWSAGYDTDYRAEMSTLIYTTDSKEEFCAAVAGEKIDYILFEEDMDIEGIPAREDLIASICDHLYTSPDGRIRIYETNYPLY